MKESTLEKYKLMVDEYFINGFNGTKAYQKFKREASSDTAKVEFSKILTIPNVLDYYNSKLELSRTTLKTSHKALLQELERWAYSDITQTISLTPYEVEQLPEEVRRLITKFKRTTRKLGDEMTEEVIELQFVSKEKAMEMIHKHVGFYGEHNFQKNVKLTKEEREERIAQLSAKLNAGSK